MKVNQMFVEGFEIMTPDKLGHPNMISIFDPASSVHWRKQTETDHDGMYQNAWESTTDKMVLNFCFAASASDESDGQIRCVVMDDIGVSILPIEWYCNK